MGGTGTAQSPDCLGNLQAGEISLIELGLSFWRVTFFDGLASNVLKKGLSQGLIGRLPQKCQCLGFQFDELLLLQQHLLCFLRC